MIKEYKLYDDKLSLIVDGIEAGYVEFNNNDIMSIEHTYIFPGYRENGYGVNLVNYFLANVQSSNMVVNCPFFATFTQEYLKRAS